MSSFTSRSIIDEIIARNGEAYPEDGSRFDAVRIVEYTTPEGQTTWGVVWRCEAEMGMGYRYDRPTDVVRNPKVIFVREE